MAEENSGGAAAPAETASPAIAFTKPSRFSEPAKPPEPAADDAGNHGKPVAETPADGAKPPEGEPAKPSVAQLAKLSKENRESRSIIARLQGELDEMKSSGKIGTDKAAEAQSELDAIKKNPRLLFKYGHTTEGILRNLTEEDDEEDPKYVELKKRLDAQEEAKKKADADALTADEKRKADENAASAAKGNANISRYIKEEGAKIGEDGTARWAVASRSPAVANAAREAVVKQLEDWKVSQSEVSNEDLADMIKEYVDQWEAAERPRIIEMAEALGYTKGEKKENTEGGNLDPFSFTSSQSAPNRQQQPATTEPGKPPAEIDEITKKATSFTR